MVADDVDRMTKAVEYPPGWLDLVPPAQGEEVLYAARCAFERHTLAD